MFKFNFAVEESENKYDEKLELAKLKKIFRRGKRQRTRNTWKTLKVNRSTRIFVTGYQNTRRQIVINI